MPLSYTTNTCISCIFVSICKVDYMMRTTWTHVEWRFWREGCADQWIRAIGTRDRCTSKKNTFVGTFWRGYGSAYRWAFIGSWSDLNWKCWWLLWIGSFGGRFWIAFERCAPWWWLWWSLSEGFDNLVVKKSWRGLTLSCWWAFV